MCKNNDNTTEYKCAICGTSHEDIQSRANCELACFIKQQEEEKAAAKAKKQAEKNERFTEASAALDNALTLVNKCVEDYGTFTYIGKLKDLDLVNMDFFPSKLWHHFWV